MSDNQDFRDDIVAAERKILIYSWCGIAATIVFITSIFWGAS